MDKSVNPGCRRQNCCLTTVKNANIAVSQNSDVYYFAKKNIIVDIQLGDGSILDKNTLVTDAVSEGDELYAIWKDVNDVDDDDEEEN